MGRMRKKKAKELQSQANPLPSQFQNDQSWSIQPKKNHSIDRKKQLEIAQNSRYDFSKISLRAPQSGGNQIQGKSTLGGESKSIPNGKPQKIMFKVDRDGTIRRVKDWKNEKLQGKSISNQSIIQRDITGLDPIADSNILHEDHVKDLLYGLAGYRGKTRGRMKQQSAAENNRIRTIDEYNKEVGLLGSQINSYNAIPAVYDARIWQTLLTGKLTYNIVNGIILLKQKYEHIY